jgi:hypothetical protein
MRSAPDTDFSYLIDISKGISRDYFFIRALSGARRYPQLLWITLWATEGMRRYGIVPGAAQRNAR